MRGPLRIAVLECDTPAPRTQAKYGGYAGVFTDLLEAGAKLLAEERGEGKVGLEITKWDVVNEERYPNLEDVNGVLMTGSSECRSSYPYDSCTRWTGCGKRRKEEQRGLRSWDKRAIGRYHCVKGRSD